MASHDRGELRSRCHHEGKHVCRGIRPTRMPVWCIGDRSARTHRKSPVLRSQVLARRSCSDFGPTPLADQLLKAKLVVDHKPIRGWLLAHPSRRTRPHAQSVQAPVRIQVGVRWMVQMTIEQQFKQQPLLATLQPIPLEEASCAEVFCS